LNQLKFGVYSLVECMEKIALADLPMTIASLSFLWRWFWWH